MCNETNLKNKKCAWLVFGIEDKTKLIAGSRFRETRKDLDSLKAEIANHTSYRITFTEIYECNMPDGRVVLFEIPAAPKGMPIAWQGHYYGRDGEELNALNIEELERIRSQQQIHDWSAEILPDASINDLSTEAIVKARNNYKAKNKHLADEVDGWSDITFLNKSKTCIKGQITRTAILLLGKPESSYLINPAFVTITWVLRDKDNIEKDYEHFSCPFLLTSEEVYKKIRNLKYRYIPDGSLFPEEVEQYDPYIIREALNNCIAHQDYTLGSKINVVEHEDGKLVFINAGQFIPGSIEEVVINDAPEPVYRNPFLLEAMINLNMIDAIGSGIKRMFNIQCKKFFPLPDYDFQNNKVKLTVSGKIIDFNYARKLAAMPDLTLHEIIALDKVSKLKELNKTDIKLLRNKYLIEGRSPNFHISSSVAQATGEEAKYIKQRGIDDNYCQKMILDYLEKFGQAHREDFEKVLIAKLPDVLSLEQKKNKIKNILQKLRNLGGIYNQNKLWKIKKI